MAVADPDYRSGKTAVGLSRTARRPDAFDWLSFGLMAGVLALALFYWHNYPVHMDTYYHMGVTSGFSSAGGVALHSFWEFAPGGRPHLYPPLLHIIMFAVSGGGVSVLGAGRIVSFFAFPLMLLTNWYAMRRLFSTRAAFYTLVLLSSCYLLFWHSAVESAASVVLILTPLVFVALERNRKVAAGLLLALVLYSHLTLGHLVALGLFIYALHRRKMFIDILEVLIGAYLLWLPWGIHIFANRSSLGFSSPVGGGVTVHALIWVAALAGFVYCYFKKDRYYLLPCFLLGFVPILFFYPDRFWDAHALVPLAMLGGVALSALHGFLGKSFPSLICDRRARSALVACAMSIPVILFLLVDPVYSTSGGRNGAPAAGARRLAQQKYSAAQQPGGGYPPGVTLPQGAELRKAIPGAAPPGVVPPGTRRPFAGAPPDGPVAIRGGVPLLAGPGGLDRNTGINFRSATLLSLAGAPGEAGSRSVSGQALIDEGTLELAALIESNSAQGQIVFAPDGGLGNLITGLTGRASTCGMFHEVEADKTGGPMDFDSASLLVLPAENARAGPLSTSRPAGDLKPENGLQKGINSVTGGVDTSGYELAGTAGGYSVYRNASAEAAMVDRGAVIPWYAVFLILALVLAAIFIDWFRPGNDVIPAERRPEEGGPAGHVVVPSGAPGDAPDKDRDGGVLAIVPCKNEDANIGAVVRELRENAPFADVLVVDDGSTDGTADIARAAGALVISHRWNQGAGAAVRTGMRYALDCGYRAAVQVDGDGQHDPQYLDALLKPLACGWADVTIGSRFMGTDGYRPPPVRRAGTAVLSAAVSLATRRKTTDATSGFRALNRKALSLLAEQYPDGYAETESLVLMRKLGIRWIEVPVSMRRRAHGKSTIRGLHSLTFVTNTLFRIVLVAGKRRQADTWNTPASPRATAGAHGSGPSTCP